MKKLTLITILCWLALIATATDLKVTLSDFTVMPATNRTVYVQNLTTPTATAASTIIGTRLTFTSDSSGVFYISNIVQNSLYSFVVTAPPSRTDFTVEILGTDTGLINAHSNMVAFSTSTFPAGSVAWSAVTSDLRYLRPGSVLHGDILTVSKTGNDSLGTRQGPDFLTLTAAKNAALSGDTIVVFPGTYQENNLLKNGVNWYFTPGAVVAYTNTCQLNTHGGDTITNDGSTMVYGIFDDRFNGAVTSNIGGNGSFFVNNRGFLLCKGTLVVTNAASRISLQANDIGFEFFRDITTEAQAGSRAAVYVLNCARVDVNVNRIYGMRGSTFDTGQQDTLAQEIIWSPSGTGVYWQLGPLYVHSGTLDTIASYSVWGDQPPGNSTTADMWITADLIENHIYMDGGNTAGGLTGSANWRTWMIVKELMEAPTYYDGGKHYLFAEKINCSTVDIGFVGATIVWINAQKISNAGGGGWMTFSAGAPSGTGCPTVYSDVQQFEDVSGSFATAGIDVAGSTTEFHLKNAFMKTAAGNTSPAIRHGAGSSRISGCTIDTSATSNAGAKPINVTGSGLIVDRCTLVASSVADSIGASSGQNVAIYNVMANRAFNANITPTPNGGYTIDSNVK